MATKGKLDFSKAKKVIKERAERIAISSGVNVVGNGKRLTPVDTANLINSWYGPEVTIEDSSIVISIGLTANYAPYVHEMVGARFRKPGSQAKFLEQPLLEEEKPLMKNLQRIFE